MNNPYKCLNQAVIPITQGSDYNDTVQVNQANGTPVDLTGYTVRSQLRSVTGSLAATFTCTITSPATGVIARKLTAIVTTALTVTSGAGYVWGVELTAPDGSVIPEIQGGALVIAEVVK